MSSLTISNLRKSFGPVDVLKGVDLEAKTGEFVALVGPSGCGKSTLLAMIAGLEKISSGEIRIDGRLVNHVAPKDRDIAMVFQSYALYPTMTVRQNITSAWRAPHVARRTRRTRRSSASPRCCRSSRCCSASPASFPAASASASPWAARWCATPNCSCSTNLCRTSMRNCASRCAPKSRSYISASARRRSMSPMTRSRR